MASQVDAFGVRFLARTAVAGTAIGPSSGSTSDAGSDLKPAGQPTGLSGLVGRKGRSPLLAIGAVVIVVVVVGAAFVLTDGFRLTRGSSTEDLIPAESYYSLPGEQYNSITFIISSSCVVNGTFTNTRGIIVYVLSPSQLVSLNHNGVVGQYTWSSGTIANLTVYSLDATIEPGQWALVFYNPNLINTTVVGFYTAITLRPA